MCKGARSMTVIYSYTSGGGKKTTNQTTQQANEEWKK